ncbi:MAG: bifunctional 5,10-methylenetetrahydrofolate dehydrogenase/5,10-methenyltetrahydrofolate cyclohydrolase [Thermoplasmata archaeon]|nr:bifunctional 5,10-methylenetetrahydrofolate dehydrogenase/5,10-methenyltetrahydrofolate cyclohydrolase [Thermoplasmata archaeon]
MTRTLDGAPAARSLLDTAEWTISNGVRKGRPRPVLAAVHRAGNTPFAMYLRQQQKTAEKIGAVVRDIALPEVPYPVDLPSLVGRLDADATVHGILLEHPLPAPWPFSEAIDRLSPRKDVDGVSPRSLGLLASRRPVNVPAVARAALRLAHHHGIALAGRRVAVVGRSETVGWPLATLLASPGPSGDATVSVAHSKTPDLKAALWGAEVIFACAGKPRLLDRTNTPEGVAVIDVGLSSEPDPHRPGRHRSVGDANAESLDGWASALSPVPGGVGPVTVAALFTNLIAGWELQTGVPGGT